MNNYCIAIAREFGSGGKEIGMKLSEKLGIPCYEQQILQMASDRSGISEELFNLSNEKLRGGYLQRMLRKEPVSYVVSPSDKEFTSDVNLFNIQAELIRDLAASESFIVIGKCADYVLRDSGNVLSVFIGSPLEDCVNSITGKMHVDTKEAERLVKRTNKYRADYYQYYTQGQEWKDIWNWDMMLNSAKIGRAQCVELIAAAVQIRFCDN